jgi:D-alanyl-D-alanine carboxypeptidase
MIAQAVAGEPIQQLIAQGILRPLDLTRTSFPPAAAPPHLPVQGYTVEGKDALPTPVFESPAELSRSGAAGAMISTVADLQVWARAPATGPCCHHPCSASGCNWSPCRCLRINGAR